MATKFFSDRNLRFVLYEVHDVVSLTQYDYYAEHNRKMFDMVLKAAGKLGKDLLLPVFEEMDRNQPELVNGEVRVHPAVRNMMKEFGCKVIVVDHHPLMKDSADVMINSTVIADDGRITGGPRGVGKTRKSALSGGLRK